MNLEKDKPDFTLGLTNSEARMVVRYLLCGLKEEQIYIDAAKSLEDKVLSMAALIVVKGQ